MRFAADWWLGCLAALGYFALLAWMGDFAGAWAVWRQDPNLAAWVQAVGAVVSIAAAGAGIWWQLQHQAAEARRQQRDEEIRRLRIVWSLAYHCRAMADHALMLLRRGERSAHLMPQMRHAIAALRAIPALDVPDAHAMIALNALFMSFANFDDNDAHGPSAEFAEQRTKVAVDNFGFSESVLRGRLCARGSDISSDTGRMEIGGIAYPALEPAWTAS